MTLRKHCVGTLKRRRHNMSKKEFERMKQGISFAKKHIDESQFSNAVVVMLAVVEQMVAHMEGEDLDDVKNPDVIITFEEDCGDEIDHSN